MTQLKKKILAVAVIAAMLTLLGHSTLAYYTVRGRATNVVTSGDITMKIHETTDDGKPFPSEGITVIPGDTVSKEVFVENVCSHPFWLRVKLVFGSTDETVSAEDVLQIVDINANQWVYRDGYYYFNRILRPGEKTVPLFEEVHISGDRIDQHNAGEALTLTVKAYAVQSENNPAETPWQVSGWPVD